MSLAASRLALATTVLSAGLAAAQPAAPATSVSPTPVVAIVTVPTPWYAPQFVVARRMRDTIPQYAQLPGLDYKMYSFAQADGQFGGIYLWRSRDHAQAWFHPGWFERVRRERGVEGKVRLFEAPVTLDVQPGGPPADDRARAVATLVLAPAPTDQSRAQLEAGFREAWPRERQRPGLLRQHLVVAADGRAGALSVWADAAAAQAELDRARQRAAREPQVTVEVFDLPILTPGQRAAVPVADAAR